MSTHNTDNKFPSTPPHYTAIAYILLACKSIHQQLYDEICENVIFTVGMYKKLWTLVVNYFLGLKDEFVHYKPERVCVKGNYHIPLQLEHYTPVTHSPFLH